MNKSKVVVVSKDGSEVAKVKYGQSELKCVSKYCYLGMVFSADGGRGRWKLEWIEECRQEEQLSAV